MLAESVMEFVAAARAISEAVAMTEVVVFNAVEATEEAASPSVAAAPNMRDTCHTGPVLPVSSAQVQSKVKAEAIFGAHSTFSAALPPINHHELSFAFALGCARGRCC